jgi:hypothetical protein
MDGFFSRFTMAHDLIRYEMKKYRLINHIHSHMLSLLPCSYVIPVSYFKVLPMCALNFKLKDSADETVVNLSTLLFNS